MKYHEGKELEMASKKDDRRERVLLGVFIFVFFVVSGILGAIAGIIVMLREGGFVSLIVGLPLAVMGGSVAVLGVIIIKGFFSEEPGSSQKEAFVVKLAVVSLFIAMGTGMIAVGAHFFLFKEDVLFWTIDVALCGMGISSLKFGVHMFRALSLEHVETEPETKQPKKKSAYDSFAEEIILFGSIFTFGFGLVFLSSEDLLDKATGVVSCLFGLIMLGIWWLFRGEK